MLVRKQQSLTYTIRQISTQIEQEINSILYKASSRTSSPQLQELKNAVIQVLTSKLPSLIDYQQELTDKIDTLNEQLQECRMKYKQLYERFQQNQLENDRLKIQVVSLSQNYEHLSIQYSQIKYQFHQLKDREGQTRYNNQEQAYLYQLKLVGKDSVQSSDRGDEQQQITHQAMQYQKQMFLQEIRSSQQQILQFKIRMQELVAQKEGLQAENMELQHLLRGQKVRSDKFDRQILDILNKNQQLKLELLQSKSVNESFQQQISVLKSELQQEKHMKSAILQEKEGHLKEISQLKQNIIQLKCEVSQQRQACSILQQREREYKGKVNEMKKQNERLRVELQNLISKLHEVSLALQKSNNQQAMHYKSCLEQQQNKMSKTEQQQRQKGHLKMKQISKMHKQITHKLQQKIHLLEKGVKEKKEKNAQLKFQIQRLYQSLQIQVEKEVKYSQTIKQLKGTVESVSEENKNLKCKAGQIITQKEGAESALRECRSQLSSTKEKLKRLREINFKLISHTLPHIKQELHSVRSLCKHFSSKIEMERQQNKLIVLRTKQSLQHLIQESSLQNAVCKEKQALVHQTELIKWKENCSLYQQKYSQLKTLFNDLEQRYKKLEISHSEEVLALTEKVSMLQEEGERKRLEYNSTLSVVERLKEKCREVEQYYKLIEELSKENTSLKNKLEAVSQYSFKSPEKGELDYTSKRRQFTSEQALQKYNTTTNMARVAYSKGEEINYNDFTSKAQYQRLRLQATKREHRMLHRHQ